MTNAGLQCTKRSRSGPILRADGATRPGYFDRGLGTYVENYVHRDKLMKEKGLVPTTQQEQMDHQHAVHEEHKQHQKDVEKFTEVYKKTNSSAEASAAAFPCNDI